MSLASLLLAFAPALAARLKPEKSKQERQLEAENKGLKQQVEDLKARLWTAERFHELEARSLRAERDRITADRDSWRERAEFERRREPREPPHPAQELQLLYQRSAMSQNAQAAMQAAMQQAAMPNPLAQQQGLHGLGQGLHNQQLAAQMQNTGVAHDFICNCIPSRARLFAIPGGVSD